LNPVAAGQERDRVLGPCKDDSGADAGFGPPKESPFEVGESCERGRVPVDSLASKDFRYSRVTCLGRLRNEGWFAPGVFSPIVGCEWHFAVQGDADRIWILWIFQ
jgi:hypothetical protein